MTKGPLYELGGISGPIMTPEYLPLEKVCDLVRNRKKVYEVNPANKSERVLLTVQNVRLENFKPIAPKTKANVGPAPTHEETIAATTPSYKSEKENKKNKYVPMSKRPDESKKVEETKEEELSEEIVVEEITESDFSKK